MSIDRPIILVLLALVFSGCPTRTVYYPDGGTGGDAGKGTGGEAGRGSTGSGGTAAAGGTGATGTGGVATGGITGTGGATGGTGGAAGAGTGGANRGGTSGSGGMAGTGGAGTEGTGGMAGSVGGHASGGGSGTGGGGGSSTTCSGTQTTCPGGCADLSTDGNNCGACGHSCLGGMCTNKTCLPVTMAHLTMTGAVGLALNSTTVFTTVPSNGSTPWSLYGVPKTAVNITPSPVLTRRVGDSKSGLLAANDTILFAESGYTSQGGSSFTVFSCTPGTCSSTEQDWYTTSGDMNACDPATQECFDAVGAGASSTIQYAKRGTASQTAPQGFSPVITMPSGISGAAGGYFYMAGNLGSSSGATNSVLQRVSEDGTSGVSTLANLGLSSLFGFDFFPIIVTSTRVYAVAGDINANTTGLISVSLPNGVGNSAPPFVPGTTVATDKWIASWGDDTAIYFANSAGQWVTCPPSGCTGTPTVLADASAAAPYLAGDAQAIYWIKTTTDPGSGQTTGFSLLKVAR